MKRQIMKSLMAFCAGVMTLFAASSLFVSCGLEEQVNALEDRVTAIENLTANLEELTAKVDALYTLKFQVTADNELQYSFDGGQNWTSTGVIVTEGAADINLVDEGDAVTITIGDQSFTIEKPEEIVFEIRAGKVYFASEATQTVSLKTSGINDVAVMSAPKGWYAEINADGKVEITAPNIVGVEPDDYDDNWNPIYKDFSVTGYVKVHACSAEGNCVVGKIAVEVTEAPTVVTAYGGKYTVVATDEYNTVYFGAAEKDKYMEQAKTLVDAFAVMDWDVIDEWPNIAAPDAEGTLADLLGAEPEVGKDYVVWAITFDNNSLPTADDIALAYYTPVKVTSVEDETKRTPYDLYATVEVAGADSYYAVSIPASRCTWGGIDYYVGEMAMGMEYGGASFAKLYTEKFDGSLCFVARESINPNPGETVYLLVLPVDGRPGDAYTEDDVKIFEYKTADLVEGGAVTATAAQITEDVDAYTELAVNLTASSEDWTHVYFGWIEDEVYSTLADDQAIVKHLLSLETTWGPTPDEFDNPIVCYDLAPGTKMNFVGFYVDKDYKYGTLAKAAYTTTSVAWAEFTELNVTDNMVEGQLENKTELEVTVASTPAASKVKYILAEIFNGYNYQYGSKSAAEMALEIHLSADAVEATLAEGKFVVPGHVYGSEYYLAILPYDANGNPGKEAYIYDSYDCAMVLTGVVADAASFGTTAPTVEFKVPKMQNSEKYNDPMYWLHDDGTYEYTVNYTVTPATGTEVKAVICDPSTITGFASMTADQKATALWGGTLSGQEYYINTFTEETTANVRTFNDSGEAALKPAILVSWKDADGKYYYQEIDLSAEFKLMYDSLNDDGILNVTIAEFKAAAITDTLTYRITGTVAEPVNTVNGNFYVEADGDKVYVCEVSNLDDYKGVLAAGKKITVVGQRGEHHAEIEVANGYIEVCEATVKEFLKAEVGEAKYMLTGAMSNIKNTTYGNFDLTDETGKVYVYGLTKEKVKKDNDKSFASIGLAEDYVVTLIGTRAEYNGSAQVGGPAYYVDHLPVPGKIQASYTWAEYGNLPTVFDFGYTTPGKLYFAFDADTYSGGEAPEGMKGKYMITPAAPLGYDYTAIPTTKTSGVFRIVMQSMAMAEEEVPTFDVPYSDYVDDTKPFKIDGTVFLMGSVEDDVEITPLTKPVVLYFETAEVYSWALANGDLGTSTAPASSVTKGTPELTWAISSTPAVTYLGWSGGDTGRGVQIGKGDDPLNGTYAMTTTATDLTVNKVVVNSSMASGGDTKVAVYVNGTLVDEAVSVTTSATDYTFTLTEAVTSPEIKVEISNTIKAAYLKSIVLE